MHQPTNVPGELPVMALPGTLLFPHALLPLYIFEDRYRLMLSECLGRQRMFCIALVRRGIDEARSGEDFHQVGGMGLIRACVANSDGTSHLILQGLTRVKFVNLVQETPFPVAQLRALLSSSPEGPESTELRERLLELCAQRRDSAMTDSVSDQLAGVADPAVLTDIVAHTYVRDPFARQTLLEQTNAIERLRFLIALLETEWDRP